MNILRCWPLVTFVLIALFFCHSGECNAADPAALSMFVKNSTGSFIQLWIWKKKNGDWDRPPTNLPKGKVDSFVADDGVNYYLAVRDDSGRDFFLGWTDLGDNLSKNATLEITKSMVYETKEYKVKVRVWENGRIVEREEVRQVRIGVPIFGVKFNYDPKSRISDPDDDCCSRRNGRRLFSLFRCR